MHAVAHSGYIETAIGRIHCNLHPANRRDEALLKQECGGVLSNQRLPAGRPPAGARRITLSSTLVQPQDSFRFTGDPSNWKRKLRDEWTNCYIKAKYKSQVVPLVVT